MEDLNGILESSLSQLKSLGADKAHVEVGTRDVHEWNVEANRFTLLRTTFDQSVAMRVITADRQASMAGNQFGKTEIGELAKMTAKAAAASAPDPAHDIAPKQKPAQFRSGPEEGDVDRMGEAAGQILQETRRRFPKIIIEQMTMQFVKRRRVAGNTNGVHFETAQSDYEFSVMFTGKDGGKTSSFNHTGVSFNSLDQSLMTAGGLEELLEQSSEQTEAKPLQGKFVGDVILTPHSLPSFLGGFASYLSAGSLLKGQSVYQNKLHEQVAVDGFHLWARPHHKEFSLPGFITGDGFLREDAPIVKNGRLETFLLNQYGANKLQKERAKCGDGYWMIDPGDVSLKDMIRSVKRGLLLCRFSGGNPASNGDVSGVAKNSFYIENGEIRYPINESMVSGNIPQMLLNIQDISRETINFGTMVMPWARVSGLTVSGK